MKENFDNNGLDIVVKSSLNNGGEFSERLEVLKEKLVKLREVNSGYFELQKEAKELAEKFIKDFKDDKAELGKIVSWLGDVISPDELIAIVGDSISHKDITNLSLKVENRLAHSYQKPEQFMDGHITNLVNVLNVYDNYIESFESIEVADDLNCLDRHKYLISHDLHNLLLNGFRLKRDREISKEETGIYLVVFKSIKVKGEDVLIYRYIKYPYIFYDTLYSYIVKESSSLVITNDKSVGVDYLFVMRYFFENRDQLTSEIKKVSDMFKHKSLYNNTRGIYPRNIIDMCKMLLQGCPVFLNDRDICEVIKLISEKKFYEVVVKLVELYDFYKNETEGLKILSEKLRKPKLDNYNFLGRLVFITDDLDSLIKDLQEPFNGKVNQGPQKWRGQSDSLSHVIDSIDNDFRKSLNRHNQYHVNNGNIPRNSLIGRSKFSYQNVHLNIGNVRWYSTRRFIQPVTQDPKEVFREIGDYLKNSPINHDTQRKIETSLYDYSYIQLVEKNSKSDKPVINYKLINKKFSDLLLDEKTKLVEYLDRYRETNFVKEPKKVNDLILYLLSVILKELDNDYLVSVIYGRLFKIVSNYGISKDSNRVVDVLVDIGTDLVQNYYYVLYSKHKSGMENGVYTLSMWKSENESLLAKFDNTTKAELGGKMINILKILDLVRLELIVKGKTERENVIIPTDRVLNTLDKENNIKPLPRRLPMIVKPRNYTRCFKNGVKDVLGGYLLNDDKYTDPLMIPKWNFGKPTIIKDDNLVYDLVNNINSVGFKINNDVLDFIGIYGSRYNLLINSSFVHPLSSRDKLSKEEFIELTSFLSQKDLQENILAIAEIYSHLPEFFLPTRLDFRGRLYCISEYLTYQSTELAKALILFSNGEKLSKYDKIGIDYLKAYGANCFGNKLDKMSWKARSKWVDDNVDKIINFRDGELIEKAEKKLLFIAFCFEYNRFLECLDNDREYFETHLPIQLDATCNGYQHLALLSLDHDLAKELNLTKSNSDDEPKDFYGFTATKLVNYFRDRLDNNNLTNEEKEVYTRFSDLKIARKIVKRAIMTIPYNVTQIAMIDYLKENFDLVDSADRSNLTYFYKEDPTVVLKEKDFPMLARGLKTVLFDDRFKLKKLLAYLNEVVSIVTTLNLPVYWGTPDTGVDIEQSYVASKEERLKVFAYTKKTFKIKVADKSAINKRKQRISFLPNFIHSLDAASLALLVHYYFTERSNTTKNIYTIHDCFAVTANNVKNLIFLLSHVYQRVYTEKNYLREFDQKMLEFIEYNCKKDIQFDKDTLTITREKGKKLQYPSVDTVLGPKSNTDDFGKSPYLVH
jgi:hypothetical protein